MIPNAGQDQVSSPTLTRKAFELAFRASAAANAVPERTLRSSAARQKKVAGKSQATPPLLTFISKDHMDKMFRLVRRHFADQAEFSASERDKMRRDLQSTRKLMAQSKAKLEEFSAWVKQQAQPGLDFTSVLSELISQEIPAWKERLSAIFAENEYIPRAQKDLLSKENPRKHSRHELISRVERLAKGEFKFPRKKREQYLVALICAVRAAAGFNSEEEARSFDVLARGAARQMLHNARNWWKANPVDEWGDPIKKRRKKKKTKRRSAGTRRDAMIGPNDQKDRGK